MPICTLHRDRPLGDLHRVDDDPDPMPVDLLLPPPLVLGFDDASRGGVGNLAAASCRVFEERGEVSIDACQLLGESTLSIAPLPRDLWRQALFQVRQHERHEPIGGHWRKATRLRQWAARRRRLARCRDIRSQGETGGEIEHPGLGEVLHKR
jgi:hypothetical protein